MLSQDQLPGAVETLLSDFFVSAIGAAGDVSPVVADAAEVLADFVLGGGKRIRPLFAHAGWHCALTAAGTDAAIEQSDADLVVRVGAALELIQACALVHDDILDRSDTRRGKPTVHRRFEARHRAADWSGGAAHYGESTAILLGDLALAWADDLVHGYRPTDPARPDAAFPGTPLPATATALWARMRTEVLAGQLLDITNEASGDETVDAANRVMEYKTAAYTVARPLEIGAALANSTPELATTLRRIGTSLGLAFQLRDDVLGAFGDPDQTGKPSGDDLVAGKRTVLVALALQSSDRSSADQLRSLLGRELSADELSTARTILVDSGALADVESQIDEHLRNALDEIAALPVAPEARADLTALAHRIAHRQH